MTSDPYRFFRIEARELLDALDAALLRLDRNLADAEAVAELQRRAHTLKGAARVVKHRAIADQAHAIEEVLAESDPPDLDRVQRIRAAIEAVAGEVRSLEQPAPGPTGASSRSGGDDSESIRVDMSDLDQLLDSVIEARSAFTRARSKVDGLARAQKLAHGLAHRGDREAAELSDLVLQLQRELGDSLDHLDDELSDCRNIADRLRMLPARNAFASWERTGLDTARALGKQITFIGKGGAERVDAPVLAALREAMQHVVRNAVVHGIEEPAVRMAAGKPAAGRIELNVRRRGERVSFCCRDDGRGFDTEAIRRAAVARGVAGAEQASDADAISQLAMSRGVSTARALTADAGRGVGLDVVRDALERLGGQLRVSSQPGRGTEVEIEVPISVAAVTSLLVEAGGVLASMPADEIERTLSFAPDDLSTVSDGDLLSVGDRTLPVTPLSALLGLPAATVAPRIAVVVRADGRAVAVAVERLIGIAELSIKPLPSLAPVPRFVVGASLDAEGTPQLALDGAELVAAVSGQRPSLSKVEIAEQRSGRILVVDDSLTTRMLEQSILESAGYEVDLAVSGEDALAKARQTEYSLMIVDVEMPGISGFEVVEALRADPQLEHIPAIIVTSRGDAADRRRGMEAGARAYIVKSEFDQERLLDLVATLFQESTG